ncbi:histone-lysine N-methyltransferase ASHR1-like isoform 2 [Thraustotheca clavata]|uniref:Histone-lysine N-methyltransferase ASHR1-like isoform 2 n=1 Tax=Thraustotheca clavata TaxID=74557 RepID=A0A1V9ZBN2_9STRA|nr:histone-lysine N-methyltransferase ASHR1-like isoform 2 [Thraustotheca clavata]
MYERQAIGGRGYGALATSPIKAGTLVLRSNSVAAIPLDPRITCAYCFTPSSLRCSRCKFLHYCSRRCQQADWFMHGAECKYIANYNSNHENGPKPTPTVLLVARLLRVPNPPKSSEYAHNLELHSLDAIACYRDMSELVLQILSASRFIHSYSIHDIVLLFAMLNCNAFTVSTLELVPVGIGFYPRATLFNHSCLPNCIATFDGRNIEVRTLCHIELGQELTISYIELIQTRATRQKELASSYFFNCTCLRCQGLNNWVEKEEWLSALRCQDTCCKGLVKPNIATNFFGCGNCGALRDSHDINLMEHQMDSAIAMSNSAERLNKLPEAISHRCQAMSIAKRLYNPLHAKYISNAETLANLIMSTKNSESLDSKQVTIAIEMFQEALNGLSWLYGDILVPMKGLTTLKYARTLYQNSPKQKQNAMENIKEACCLLTITHGENSFLVKQAVDMLHEMQR